MDAVLKDNLLPPGISRTRQALASVSSAVGLSGDSRPPVLWMR